MKLEIPIGPDEIVYPITTLHRPNRLIQEINEELRKNFYASYAMVKVSDLLNCIIECDLGFIISLYSLKGWVVQHYEDPADGAILHFSPRKPA